MTQFLLAPIRSPELTDIIFIQETHLDDVEIPCYTKMKSNKCKSNSYKKNGTSTFLSNLMTPDKNDNTNTFIISEQIDYTSFLNLSTDEVKKLQSSDDLSVVLTKYKKVKIQGTNLNTTQFWYNTFIGESQMLYNLAGNVYSPISSKGKSNKQETKIIFKEIIPKVIYNKNFQ